MQPALYRDQRAAVVVEYHRVDAVEPLVVAGASVRAPAVWVAAFRRVTSGIQKLLPFASA
ncbi:MAG: hypothetical protein NT117_04140 [Gammaproteobacteria bacterium]|nr:hypothetical protein [Gammaproteobacteria bacterium]